MISIFDSVSEICHEIESFYEFRPHSTIFRTEISSRIHFWGLEGPEMVKNGLNLRFSIKSQFSWGRFRSDPPARPPAAAAAAAYPRPDCRLITSRGHKISRLRKIWSKNRPFKKNIQTLGRKQYFLFYYTPITVKIRNGQTLEKIQVFLLRGVCVYIYIYMGAYMDSQMAMTCRTTKQICVPEN